MEQCTDHSGCIKDIDNLKSDNSKQWKELDNMRSRIDGIFTRLNILLGGVVVACVMLVINIFIR